MTDGRPAADVSTRGVEDLEIPLDEGPTAPDVDHDEGGVTSAVDVATRSRTRAFILLRFTLIIATACMLLAEVGAVEFVGLPLALFGLALLSNVAAVLAPRRLRESPLFTAGAVVGDTVWITAALISTGQFTAEFFYLYFFVLFLAAIGENLRLISIGVVLVCVAYVVVIFSTQSVDQLLETQFLIRLPFLFAVAIFYGYLVDRLRREKLRVREERVVVGRLEDNRAALEEAIQALKREMNQKELIESSLKRANERLQELSETKSRFFTTVSHEIKTPITSIKNAVSLIRSGGDPSAVDGLLDMIGRNADRLNLIFSDILDVSRVDSGSLRIRPEVLDLDIFLPRVLETLTERAEQDGVRLELQIPGLIPTVWADGRRIEEILENLVDNGLRATAKGGFVVVRAEEVGAFVELSVKDNGIGLTGPEQRQVFEPFFQTGDVLVDRPAGAGLGLTICRDSAHGHGSELDVESKRGVGSRFFFKLPVKSAKGSELLEFEDSMRATYRKHPYFVVLVVDQSFPEGTSMADRKKVLERLRDRLRTVLPRETDRFVIQPGHGRVVIVLLTTPRDGGWVVRRRMKEALGAEPMEIGGRMLSPPRVFGPASYPEDGQFGSQLVGIALSIDNGTTQEEL